MSSRPVASNDSTRVAKLDMLILTEYGWHRHTRARRPAVSQRLDAKLVDSAILKPWLKPAWYASGKVMTISPARCKHVAKGMRAAFSTIGAMSTCLWRRNSGQA